MATDVHPASPRAARLLIAGVLLVAVTGLIAIGTGVFFITSDQPFDRQGFSEELDMTRAQARDASPEMESWVRHVQNQVGSVSIGWGLFVTTLAWTGLRRGNETVRNILWIGALPTLLYSSLHEFLEFGTVDTGTLLSLGALALFVLGMALTYIEYPLRRGKVR